MGLSARWLVGWVDGRLRESQLGLYGNFSFMNRIGPLVYILLVRYSEYVTWLPLQGWPLKLSDNIKRV